MLTDLGGMSARIAWSFMVCTTALSLSYGQSENTQLPETQKSADEIARELANPNAALGLFLFAYDQTWYQGSLPEAGDQTSSKLVIQPSLPYPIEPGVNVFFRPLIPVFFQQPVYSANGFENKGFNLGDISLDAAIGKSWKSGFVGVAGVFASFPTATEDVLSANQTILGPEALAAFVGKWGAAGVLFSQGWGLTSDADKRVSSLGGQYFVIINLGNAWQFNAQPVFSYNWNGSAGNRLALPIPLGVKKTIIIGDTPVNVGLQYWYYVATPDNFGSRHLIRFSVIPVLPLPW